MFPSVRRAALLAGGLVQAANGKDAIAEVSTGPCGGGCAFDRVDVGAADDDAEALLSFRRRLAAAERPLVLRGLLSKWSAVARWPTPADFARLYGDGPGFARDHDHLEIRDWETTVAEYLGGTEASSSVGKAANLSASAAFFVNDFEDSRLLDRLREDCPPPRILDSVEGLRVFSLERPGAGVTFHHHEQAWQAQLVGRKVWYLASPSTESVPQGRPCEFASSGSEPPLAECCVVEPGEVIYLPNQWWHATCSLPSETASIAIGGVGSLRDWPAAHVAARRGDLAALTSALDSDGIAGLPAFPAGIGILKGGELPLTVAASFGHAAAVDLLLARRADANARRSDGGTAAMEAARRGDVAIIQRLVTAGADLAAIDKDGATSLHHACKGNAPAELVAYLLSKGLRAGARQGSDGRSPSHLACTGTRDPVAKLRQLLGTGDASPLSQDTAGLTPLALCAARGHARGVGLLLKFSGKDAVTTKDRDGRDALRHALAGRADAGVVRRLLDARASISSAGDGGLARSAAGVGESETLRLLLAAGASPDGALHEAARAGHAATVRELLLFTSQQLRQPQHEPHSNEDAERSVAAFVNSLGDEEQATPLHMAGLQGHIACVRVLLNARADVTIQDADGLLPIHYAAMSVGRARLHRQREVLEALAAGDWQRSDKRGATALHFAAATGDLDLAQWLAVDAGTIDPCTTDGEGNSPAASALQLNHTKLAKALEKWCSASKRNGNEL
eukprot:TRINITY_DN26188_c0_g3_i1.p1 TRINITY_DN26188_c0_g3~~TRINITY_DN26188_c0_g3_i1.p1  ORF type:complete len:756 (+),score=152.95 TRINITY_DN26188_c0_g3_i1:60-2270(+)